MSPAPTPLDSPSAAPRRRVLLLSAQLPHDPTSGSAITLLSIARLLASAGFSVRVLATSAIEGATPIALLPHLSQRGASPEVDRRGAVGKGCPVVRFDEPAVSLPAAPVRCTILDVGALALKDWDFLHGNQFNRLLLHELETFQPEIVLTAGSEPADHTRRYVCRAAGASVVLSLCSLAQLHPLAFDHVDAVMTPSRFLADLYASEIGLVSTHIPPPIDPVETLTDSVKHEPRYCTFVNPIPAKGLHFFVTLADELASRRPDIPLQVIESRGRLEHLRRAADQAGFNLARHPNLRVTSARPRPRDVFSDTRLLLVPSLLDEPAGRLAIEAMYNGVCAVVSGRGALAEVVAAPFTGADSSLSAGAREPGAVVVPIPSGISPRSNEPVNRDAVHEWIDAVVRCHDDEHAAGSLSARARAIAAAKFDPAEITRRYVAFFDAVQLATTPLIRSPGASSAS